MPFRNSNLGGCDGNENAACEEFLDGLLRCLTQQLHVKDSFNMINVSLLEITIISIRIYFFGFSSKLSLNRKQYI